MDCKAIAAQRPAAIAAFKESPYPHPVFEARARAGRNGMTIGGET